jgi:hypothetical protein
MEAVRVLNERIASAKEKSFDGFITECDAVMTRDYKVKYSDIAEIIHPSKEAARSAYDHGQSPGDFVAETALEHGLKKPTELRDRDDAHLYNLSVGAISEFVGSKNSVGWQRRENGQVILPMDDGFAVMHPVKAKDGNVYGFAIDKRDGGVLHEDGVTVVSQGTLGDQWAAAEIEAVVERFQQDNTPKFLAY